MTAKGLFKYDVAFSLLDQDEQLARAISDSLTKSGLTVFVYSEQQASLVGNDGVDEFSRVFAHDARIVVVLHREKWGQTKWTRIEETAIKNRVLEDGANFLTFVPLEKDTPTPAWLPATRIWLNLERFGVEGAAAVLEERVKSAGGVTREETVEENAARLNRERESRSRRAHFLSSEEGVRAARREVGQLLDRIKSLETAAEFIATRVEDAIAIYRKGRTVQVFWSNRYVNTLKHSRLNVQEWSGRPNFGSDRYAHVFEQPAQLSDDVFMVDLVNDADIGWRDANERFYTTKSLAELCVNKLLELVRADEGSRDDWH